MYPFLRTDLPVLTAEPNSIDKTRSSLLCSLVCEQDRHERHRESSLEMLVSKYLYEQSSPLFFFTQILIPFSISCFASCL